MDDFAISWVRARMGQAHRRQITVLSCSSVRASAAGDGADSDEPEGDQDLAWIVRCVTQHGGLVTSATGQTALAIWGYPRSSTDDVLRCTAAAQEIVGSAPKGAALRCAIDIGTALVVPRRGDASLQPRLFGSVAKRAAALRDATAAGNVAVSDAARRIADCDPAWQDAISSRRMTSIDDLVELLQAEPAASDVDAAMLTRIAERSEGNALFAVELLRGYLAGWSESPDELFAQSSVLVQTLQSELDRLGELRPIALAASVLGRTCDARHLAALLEIHPAKLEPVLAAVAGRGLLVQEDGRQAVYRFSHGLLRELAYASIARSRRRRLHRAAAELLATHARNDRSIERATVAWHYERGGDASKACAWWRAAAERAIDGSAPAVAVAYLERALAAASAMPSTGASQEIDLLALLAPQLVILRGNASPAVIDIYRRGIALAEADRGADDPKTFDLMWGLHTCMMVAGRIEQAIEIGESLTSSAERVGSDERIVLAHRVQGLAKLLAGRIEPALVHYARVAQCYDPARHAGLAQRYASDQGALALAHMSWAHALAGRIATSHDCANEALALADRLRNPHTSAHVLCILAARSQTLGEREAAAALGNAGKLLADQHGFTYWSAWASIVLGALAARRDADAGIAAIEQAIADYTRTGAEQALPWARLLLAQSILERGDARSARTVSESALDMAESRGLLLYTAELGRVGAQAMLRLGESRDIVARRLDRAAAVAERQGARLFTDRIAHARAEARLARV